MQSIDDLKKSNNNVLKYQLSNANVFVSTEGYHYIDYLDPVEDISPEIDETALTDKEVLYIQKSLQSNSKRFNDHVDIVKKHVFPLKNKNVLDIGCGGGLFLSKLRDEGAIVTGIELNDARAFYAQTKYNLKITKQPIEDDYWSSQVSTFDIISLWDVIEHVNYPLSTLQSVSQSIKSGGMLFIDTPCRDSFYHRFGELTYKISNGIFPTFLNTMYSAHKFGHKQIFSSSEMKNLLEKVDFDVIELKKFHELSFPYSFYLKKMFKSNLIVKLALPIVSIFLTVFPVKNKVLIIGRKR